MIQANNLYKTYADKVILHNVTFTLSEGQKVGLVAPNGTGKSTILKMIQGLEEPDRGSVTISQENIAYLPQELSSTAGETIFDYLRTTLEEDWETWYSQK
ncbi:MAG: ATP-binding cassette domain-containing protein [Patescibacteria group bacterium]